MSEVQVLSKADLVFVMGTSLKVFPFNMLPSVIDKNCPVVLINFEDVVSGKYEKIERFLFLKGDIDSHVKRICDAAEI